MKTRLRMTLGALALSSAIALPSLLKAAAVYNVATGINAIATNPGGEMFIRFDGAPKRGPCGQNFGWVVIPPASNVAMKSLAETLYFNRQPVRIDTAGCYGTYEKVVALYSPGG